MKEATEFQTHCLILAINCSFHDLKGNTADQEGKFSLDDIELDVE